MCVSTKRVGSMRRVITEAKAVSIENIRVAQRNGASFKARAAAAKGKATPVYAGKCVTVGGVLTRV